ncbi:serine proteinase stubble-like [Musca vetustissima]|uniref:serine proteinase stubble-like n=1 Tax=Musca vetustissima TaxID=27455 RepID=UPI002AB6AF59|nr:serine proteinase stubble-like [Musca vetustissima]
MSLHLKLISLFVCVLFLDSIGALFEQCNHQINMQAGDKLYINSPYYPGEYPIGTSCRYTVIAPEDYALKFKCDIKLNTPSATSQCVNEVFYFNGEGSELLSGSEYFCGRGQMERTSFLNRAVFSYISTPPNKRTLVNVLKEVEQAEKIKETKTRIKTTKHPKTTTTTTTTTPSTTKKTKTKANTLTRTTTTKKPLQMTTPRRVASKPTPARTTTRRSTLLTTTTVRTTKRTSSTTPLPASDVSNSFAYVVALLSNKVDLLEFEGAAAAEAYSPLASSSQTPNTSSTAATTSVFNFSYDILPASTWRNGPIDISKISPKRVAKVIVGQDYHQSSPLVSETTNKSTTTPTYGGALRAVEGGGSFSCLVEVIQPPCDCGWGSTTKIVGASGVAGLDEFPAMAGIMAKKTSKIFCGAAIIHHRYLLSAAHCYVTAETNRAELLQVVVGEHDTSTVLESTYTRYYDISQIIIHEFFRSTASRVHNDIALLKTRTAIAYNRFVGPACLPFLPVIGPGGHRKAPVPGHRVETAGWGTTSFGGQQSSVLLKTTLDVISRESCQKLIHYLPAGAFCTYTPGRDTCQYDSGGALYLRGERLYAVGIVSYGFACASNQPSVNTRVASHLKWIRTKTLDAQYCVK